MSAIDGLPAVTGDDASGGDPGDELRKLAKQYGGGHDGAPASSVGSTAGDSLAALAKQYATPAPKPFNAGDLLHPFPREAMPTSREMGNLVAKRDGEQPGTLPDAAAQRLVVPNVRTPSMLDRAIASADATQVGAPTTPGIFDANYPGSLADLERNAPTPETALGRAAAAVGHMAIHPVETATGFVTAPLDAAATLGKALAERTPLGQRAVASGRQPHISGDQAKIAGVQVAATLLAPELASTFGKAAQVVLPGALGEAAGHVAAGATVGGTFSPGDPTTGMLVGGLLTLPWGAAADASIATAAKVRPAVAAVFDQVRETQRQAAQGQARAGAADVLRNAVAQLAPADVAYAANDPHFGPIFRQALAARGVTTGAGLANRPTDTSEPGPTAADVIQHEQQLRGELQQATDPDVIASIQSRLGQSALMRQKLGLEDVPVRAAATPTIEAPGAGEPSPRVEPPQQAAADHTPASVQALASTVERGALPGVRMGEDDATRMGDLLGTVSRYMQRGVDWREAIDAVGEDDAARDNAFSAADLQRARQILTNYRPTSPEQQGGIDAQAARHATFPITANDLVAHAQAKGHGLTPEGIEQSAATLRDAGYPVTDDLVRQAKGMATRVPTPEPVEPYADRQARGETFEDQRNRMVGEVEAERQARQGTPAPSIGEAETGRPFRATLLRGEGRESSPYNEMGAQVPILGEGRYTTSDAEHARFFGPNVTEHDVALRNPLVIATDADWRALTKRAGWKFPNPFGQEPGKVGADIARLRAMIERDGHDGVVVRIPSDEGTGKTLQHVFGADQVVEFHEGRPTAEPSTGSEAGDALRDLARRHGAPESEGTALAPEPKAAPRNPKKVLDEDGVTRFTEARTPSGGRRPVGTVSMQGLVDDYARLLHENSVDQGHTFLQPRESQGATDTAHGTVMVNTPARTKALGRITARMKSIADIEAELGRRGLDGETLNDRLASAFDRMTEREGLQTDEKKRGTYDEPITDEHGRVLFSKLSDEGPDLFGEEQGGESQGQLFGEREGTAASRNLRQTEQAARGELDRLRQQFDGVRDPAERATVAARIATLERLVNRGSAIGADELRARLAGEGEPGATGERGLFDARTPDEPVEEHAPIATERGGTQIANAFLDRKVERTPPDRLLTSPNKFVDALYRVFAPQLRSAEAGFTGRSIREHAADVALRDERARQALREAAKAFDQMPVREARAFINRLENGERQPTPVLQQFADRMRSILDSTRDEIRALGTGALEHFYENYWPHLWRDPEAAKSLVARILGKRELTGSGTFLKQRTIATFADGIEAGLLPVSENPVDVLLLKNHEMTKYLAGVRILQELQAAGHVKFVSSLAKPEPGSVPIDGRIGTVYGPPKVTVSEAYDKLVVDKLQEVIKALGIQHERKPNIGGKGRLGYADMGSGRKMVTKSATPESVMMHELGHLLDAQFGLWERLTDPSQLEGRTPSGKPSQSQAARERMRAQINTELRAVADLRYEGQEPGPGFRDYVRQKEEKIAAAVNALLYMPERMQEVAPTVKARLEQVLGEDPRTAKLLDVKPSLVLGSRDFDVKTAGLVILGRYHAPEPVARVLNNYLSPGLRGNPFFDAYMNMGGLMNLWQLGWSAFHLGFSTLDATVSKTALGLQQLASGAADRSPAMLGRGALSLGKAAIPGYAPIENLWRGDKMLRHYLNGGGGEEMAKLIDAHVAGGGRGRMDSFYRDNFKRQLSDASKLATDYAQQHQWLKAARWGTTAAVKLPGRVMEWSSHWLMEEVVPRQKLGVAADMIAFELERLGPSPTRDQVRETMGRVVDSVDNRLGQMVHDNNFWNRAAKDLAHASIRAVGWQLGTIREIGGGVNDFTTIGPRMMGEKPGPAITPRMAYVGALAMTVGLYGAIYTYLATGHGPRTLLDYYYPPTGRTNPDGTDERVQLPSYARDVGDYQRHPINTVLSKVHPALAFLGDLLQNEDFFGNQIINPDDPAGTQAAQAARDFFGRFEPMGVRNALDQRKRGQGLGTQAQNFVGITPAPREVTRTPASERMTETMTRRARGISTPEEVEQHGERRQLQQQLRTDPGAALRALATQVQTGQLDRADAKRMKHEARVPADVARFQSLPLAEAVRVYQAGTPDEQQAWRHALVEKVRNAHHRGDRTVLPPGLLSPTPAR